MNIVFQTHEGKGSKPSLALAVPTSGLGDWDGRTKAKLVNGGSPSLTDSESTTLQCSIQQPADDDGNYQLKHTYSHTDTHSRETSLAHNVL